MTVTKKTNAKQTPVEQHEQLEKVLRGGNGAKQWHLPGKISEIQSTSNYKSSRKTN